MSNKQECYSLNGDDWYLNDIDYIIDKFQKEQRIGFDKSIVVIEDLDKNIALKAIEKVNNERIDIVDLCIYL